MLVNIHYSIGRAATFVNMSLGPTIAFCVPARSILALTRPEKPHTLSDNNLAMGPAPHSGRICSESEQLNRSHTARKTGLINKGCAKSANQQHCEQDGKWAADLLVCPMGGAHREVCRPRGCCVAGGRPRPLASPPQPVGARGPQSSRGQAPPTTVARLTRSPIPPTLPHTV